MCIFLCTFRYDYEWKFVHMHTLTFRACLLHDTSNHLWKTITIYNQGFINAFTFTNWKEIFVIIHLNHFSTDYSFKSITNVSCVNITRTHKTPSTSFDFVFFTCFTNSKQWWDPYSEAIALIAFNAIFCSITVNGSVNDIPPRTQ